MSKVASLAGRYDFKEDSFFVKDTTPDDHGNYTCSIPDLNLSADIRVVGEYIEFNLNTIASAANWFWFNFVGVAYLKKLHENMVVVEGERLTIHCKALGTDPEIVWTVGKLKYTKYSKNTRIIYLGKIFRLKWMSNNN